MPASYDPAKYKAYYAEHRKEILERSRAQRVKKSAAAIPTGVPDTVRQQKYIRQKVKANQKALTTLMSNARITPQRLESLVSMNKPFFLGFFTTKQFNALLVAIQQEWATDCVGVGTANIIIAS
jgi:5,10-methylenetetrahydrofolate reductase